MRRVFTQVEKVASADAAVLLRGESGVGKEMVARAIHRLSKRNAGHFIAVNCGGVQDSLLESELFGYEQGAFPGATDGSIGQIEAASNGTLFLDEVGELPLPFQVKLLRVLQDEKIYRIGGRTPVPVNLRIIASSTKDLEHEATEGRFRWDLFYRLSVIPITVPPLKERVSDIAMLANFFLEKFLTDNPGAVDGFSKEGMQAMEAHTWPGNVRELENRVKRAVIMSENRMIGKSDLGLDERRPEPAEAKTPTFATKNLKEARQAVERQMVEEALERNNRKISRAASELGVSRPTLYEMIDKYNISRS